MTGVWIDEEPVDVSTKMEPNLTLSDPVPSNIPLKEFFTMNKLTDLELECFAAGKGGKGGGAPAPAPEKKDCGGPSCPAPAPAPCPTGKC